MKNTIKTFAAATVISALFASSAFAMTATNRSVSDALNRSMVDTVGLNVSVKNGVATLSGTTKDSANRERAARIVRKAEGVNSVINLVTGS